MKILCDSREQKPYLFSDFDVEVERATLATGDYSIAGLEDLVGVERKNGLDELVTCLCSDRQRFEAELARARSFERFWVIVEANFGDVLGERYRSRMSHRAVIASLAAFENRYGVPFLFCGGRGAAEMMTYQLLSKFLYEIEKRLERSAKAQSQKAA